MAELILGPLGPGEEFRSRAATEARYFTTDADALFVLDDYNSLLRLLTILLDNAARYTPPGGAMTLSVVREQKRAILVLATRESASPGSIKRGCLKDFTADRVRSGSAKGSGLGLALAKWIVEKHGTELSLESTVGTGTLFHFAISATEPVAATEIRAPEQEVLNG